MNKERQLGFADCERSMVKKQTKREAFLAVMEKVVPWEQMEEMRQSLYGKQDKTVGHNPYPLSMMLRIHVLQHWYSLSDARMEEELIDLHVVRSFAGIDLMEGTVPDESTILTFRHLLEEGNLAEAVFKMVNQNIEEQGLLMRQRTIVTTGLLNKLKRPGAIFPVFPYITLATRSLALSLHNGTQFILL